MNKIIKNTAILTAITLIAGLLLGLVYEVTKTPIAQTQEAAKREAWLQVFPEASEDDFEAVEDSDHINIRNMPGSLLSGIRYVL